MNDKQINSDSVNIIEINSGVWKSFNEPISSFGRDVEFMIATTLYNFTLYWFSLLFSSVSFSMKVSLIIFIESVSQLNQTPYDIFDVHSYDQCEMNDARAVVYDSKLSYGVRLWSETYGLMENCSQYQMEIILAMVPFWHASFDCMQIQIVDICV